MDSSSIILESNKNSLRRVKEENNKVKKNTCKKKKKQEKELRKKFKKAQLTASKARVKPGFILNSSDEDDDKMKKPELLVIPVTQSNVSEIQCLPLQMASNNTPPIVNALDEQNTNNTRSFTSDEQEIDHQNKNKSTNTSKDIRRKSPNGSPDPRRKRYSSSSKPVSQRRSPTERQTTFRRGSFSRSPSTTRIISQFQNSHREPEDVVKRRELREKYVHEIQKTKKKKINKWEIKSTLYIESDAYRDEEFYEDEFYEEEYESHSKPNKSQTGSNFNCSTEKNDDSDLDDLNFDDCATSKKKISRQSNETDEVILLSDDDDDNTPKLIANPEDTIRKKETIIRKEVSEFVKKIKDKPLPPQDQVLPHELNKAKVPYLAHCTKAAVESNMRLKSKQAAEALHAGKFKKQIRAALPAWQPAVASPTKVVSTMSSTSKSSPLNCKASLPVSNTENINISGTNSLKLKSPETKESDTNLSTCQVNKNKCTVVSKSIETTNQQTVNKLRSSSTVTVITDSEDESLTSTALKPNDSTKLYKCDKLDRPLITKASYYESSDDDTSKEAISPSVPEEGQPLNVKHFGKSSPKVLADLSKTSNTLNSTPVISLNLIPNENLKNNSELEKKQQKRFSKNSSLSLEYKQVSTEIPIVPSSRLHSSINHEIYCENLTTNKRKLLIQGQKSSDLISSLEKFKTKVEPQSTPIQIQKHTEPFVSESSLQSSSTTITTLPSCLGSPISFSRNSSIESSISEPRLKVPRISVSSLVNNEEHLPNPFDKMDCGKSKTTNTSEDDTVTKVSDPRLFKATYRKSSISKSSCISISKLSSKEKNKLPELLQLPPRKKQLVKDDKIKVASTRQSTKIVNESLVIPVKNLNEEKLKLDVYRERLLETINKCNMYESKSFKSNKKIKEIDIQLKKLKKQRLQEEEARDRSLKQLKEMQTRKEQLIKTEKKLANALGVESKADEVERSYTTKNELTENSSFSVKKLPEIPSPLPEPISKNPETVIPDQFNQGLRISTLKLLDEEFSMEVEDCNKRKRTADAECEIAKKRLKDNQLSPETVCKKIATVEVRKQDSTHHNKESSITFVPKKRISHIPSSNARPSVLQDSGTATKDDKKDSSSSKKKTVISSSKIKGVVAQPKEAVYKTAGELNSIICSLPPSIKDKVRSSFLTKKIRPNISFKQKTFKLKNKFVKTANASVISKKSNEDFLLSIDENRYSFPLSFIIANFARELKTYSDDNKFVSFYNPGYRFISTKSEWMSKVPISDAISENRVCENSNEVLKSWSVYESPLASIKSYRLSDNFKQNLDVMCYTHMISPFSTPLCVYDLTGECRYSECNLQHVSLRNGKSMTMEEIFLDLISYCPHLLKDENGKQLEKSTTMAEKLLAAKRTANKFADGANMAKEERIRKIIKTIKKAYSKNAKWQPFTVRSKEFVPCSEKNIINNSSEMYQNDNFYPEFKISSYVFENMMKAKNFADNFWEEKSVVEFYEIIENFSKQDLQNKAQLLLDVNYFDEEKFIAIVICCLNLKHTHTAINLVMNAVELYPKNFKLKYFLLKSCMYSMAANKKFAYPLYKFNEEFSFVKKTLSEIPFYYEAWKLVLEAPWQTKELQDFMELLIQNLMYRKNDDLNLTHPECYYSSWLLKSILQFCHVTFSTGKEDKCKTELNGYLKTLKRMHLGSEKPSSPMTIEDMVTLQLISIYLKTFNTLPPFLYDQGKSQTQFGFVTGKISVKFFFKNKNIEDLKDPEKLEEDLQGILEDLNNNRKKEHEIFRLKKTVLIVLIDLFTIRKKWDSLHKMFLYHMVNVFDKISPEDKLLLKDSKSFKEIFILFTVRILDCNKQVKIQSMFRHAQEQFPYSPQIMFNSSKYLLKKKKTWIDIEAHLKQSLIQALESNLPTVKFLQKLEENSLTEIYELLLDLKSDCNGLSSYQFMVKKEAKASFDKERVYLWLTYCLLQDYRKISEFIVSKKPLDLLSNLNVFFLSTSQCAAMSQGSDQDTKIIDWEIIEMITLLSKSLEDSKIYSSNDEAFQNRKRFLKWFVNIIMRTLKTTSSKKNLSQIVSSDFTFHNQYIQIVMNMVKPLDDLRLNLVELMPNNIEFCTKSGIYFLNKKKIPEAQACLKQLIDVRHLESCKDLSSWKTFVLTIVHHGSQNELREAVVEMARAIPRSRKMWEFAVKIMFKDKKFLKNMAWPIYNFLETNINDFIKSINVQVKVEKVKE